MKASAATLLLLAAAACAPEVPSEPTWVDDVRPILAANCIRCHSPPFIGGVPTTFRLDKYDNDLAPDLSLDDDDDPEPLDGAGTIAEPIADATSSERMPPRFPLTDRQIEVLANWHQAGAPHGEPRSDNALPTMTLSGDIQVSDGRVAFEYEIDDADGDIVTGTLLADPGGGADPMPIVVSNELFAGRGTLEGELATGTYELVAELDDGNGTAMVELGTAVVP